MTVRANKAWKSLVKRTRSYGHPLTFTDTEFFEKVVAAVRDGGCPYCFGPLTWDNFSPDHVIPLLKGGSGDLSNIEIVCHSCNVRKGPYSSVPPPRDSSRESSGGVSNRDALPGR